MSKMYEGSLIDIGRVKQPVLETLVERELILKTKNEKQSLGDDAQFRENQNILKDMKIKRRKII